ncbi:MAG: 23S rRNA (guanosine(2251)-2'-O)-methyltransferase RlmB [Hyphomicrobiaceae bacterium]|nr:23S rRNA (guanosine(2251)-2'-O)-methyltransferase RlmB [Hyphomicrobiaceae bacterium]
MSSDYRKQNAVRRWQSGGRASGPPAAAGPRFDPERVELFGLHAVQAALANPARPIHELHLTENAERRLGTALAGRELAVTRTSPRDLDRRLGPDTVHQGILLVTAALPEPSFEDMTEAAHAGRPLIVLDQVTDPHNVGAILRSAAVFGAGGLIMTRRHSPPPTGTLAKSASGALEIVPIHLTQNLARALAGLREAGIEVVGLAGDADAAIEDHGFDKPVALVLGAEGKGLRQSTAEGCAMLCRIHAGAELDSLNVSNAAAVALHMVAFRRRQARSGP